MCCVFSKDSVLWVDCWLVFKLICILSLYSNVNKIVWGVKNLLEEKLFLRYLLIKIKLLIIGKYKIK